MRSAPRNGRARRRGRPACPARRLITVPDTTHYVQNQRPDAVVAAIREAIARYRPAPLRKHPPYAEATTDSTEETR